MKLLKSAREIELVSDFDTVNKYPCVTVEKCNKWNSLFLITEDFKVFEIENEIYGETSEPSIFTKEFSEAWYNDVKIYDHSWEICWEPLSVLSVLYRFNMYMGKSAYEALVMRWVEEHCKEPGFECDYIPSKELYDRVIVPDNGDNSNCDSFTPEERIQFKFYKEDEREIVRKFKELSEMYNIPIITSKQIPDEDSDLLQTDHIFSLNQKFAISFVKNRLNLPDEESEESVTSTKDGGKAQVGYFDTDMLTHDVNIIRDKMLFNDIKNVKTSLNEIYGILNKSIGILSKDISMLYNPSIKSSIKPRTYFLTYELNMTKSSRRGTMVINAVSSKSALEIYNRNLVKEGFNRSWILSDDDFVLNESDETTKVYRKSFHEVTLKLMSNEEGIITDFAKGE